MHTDDDLRIALLEFVERNEPDELAVRAEIERRLQEPGGRNRSTEHGSRVRTLVSVAACIVLVVAVAVGVHLSRTHRSTPPATPPATPGPTVLGAPQFPGTIVVAEFHGTGSQTVGVPRRSIPSGSQLAVVVRCHGTGSIAVEGNRTEALFSQSCADGLSEGGSLDNSDSTVQITAAGNTSWQVALVIQPLSRTNGTVGSPETGVFASGPTTLGVGTGRGNGTVDLVRPNSTQLYQLYLTCTGDGVTITSSAQSVQDDYTKTCFDGWTYSWTLPKGTLPAQLHIAASSNTTWTVAVNPV